MDQCMEEMRGMDLMHGSAVKVVVRNLTNMGHMGSHLSKDPSAMACPLGLVVPHVNSFSPSSFE